MANIEAKNKTHSLVQFVLVVLLLILVNWLANSRIGGRSLFAALDLTEDQRYTLTPSTVEQIEDLEEVVFVRVLLEGDFPAGYQRLQNSVRELLEDFRGYNSLVEFEFSDPLAGDPAGVQERQRNLAEQEGILPLSLVNQSANQREVKAIYPYAIIYYKGRQNVVNLLENDSPGVPQEVILNKANALLEYKFSSAIEKLVSVRRPLIAITSGHGELPPIRTSDIEKTLREQYEVGHLDLDSVGLIPNDVDLLIIAKPTEPFNDKDAFKIDQYIMNGGRVLFSVDAVAMALDSLRGRNEFFPEATDLGKLEDLFFRYGFRLNQDLVLDLVNTRIPIRTSTVNGQPQIEKFPFPYHVLALPNSTHPIVKNLDPIDLRFPSSIDLDVETNTELKKIPLLTSSDRSRYQRLPSAIDLDVQKYSVDLDRFDKEGLVMAALLEGPFQSPYANRISSDNLEVLKQIGQEYQSEIANNRVIIVSDGDLLSNGVSPDGEVRPLGLNVFEGYQFDNKTLVQNMVEYLLNDQGVILARGKEVKLRLLNRDAAAAEAGFWRSLNIALPLGFLLLFGLVYNYVRRRRYAKK
ncbi:gliding motility-associated ABC transporter substrate-binding protein GldG [Lewinellaceae bacterium SD302]|nr:gliding motility-associated ABC transporter substrate-binding protein GldG [Lewinellaceae bacterium SD302]